MDWMLENWEVMSAAGAALLVLAAALVKLTKTKKDDKVVEAIQDVVATVQGKQAKIRADKDKE